MSGKKGAGPADRGRDREAQTKTTLRSASSKPSVKSEQVITGEVLAPVSPKDWAKQINLAWRKTAESIIETGRLLIECKAAMPGHFMKMVRDQLDFGLDTAERLMSIARHPALADSAVLRTLPRSYVTLAVDALVRPFSSAELYPTPSRDNEVKALTDQIDRLKSELHMAQSMASGKVASLAEARRLIAESEAPIVKTSSIDRHAALTSSSRFVGDHPDVS